MNNNETPTKDVLLPCPFCGSRANFGGDEHSVLYVASDNVGCYCAVGEAYDSYAMPDHSFYNEQEAAAAWNKRAAK